jgi:hypothetical protein
MMHGVGKSLTCTVGCMRIVSVVSSAVRAGISVDVFSTFGRMMGNCIVTLDNDATSSCDNHGLWLP